MQGLVDSWWFESKGFKLDIHPYIHVGVCALTESTQLYTK